MRQPLAHGGEVLHRVQRTGAAARRVKVVGDDHVVALRSQPHEIAGRLPSARAAADSARVANARA